VGVRRRGGGLHGRAGAAVPVLPEDGHQVRLGVPRGIGLVSTFVALLLASLLSNGLSISGIGSWVGATVVVWLVTAVATLVLPMLVLREKKGNTPGA